MSLIQESIAIEIVYVKTTIAVCVVFGVFQVHVVESSSID